MMLINWIMKDGYSKLTKRARQQEEWQYWTKADNQIIRVFRHEMHIYYCGQQRTSSFLMHVDHVECSSQYSS